MSLCAVSSLTALRDEVLALIQDLRKHAPVERLIAISKETQRDHWGMKAILKRLDLKPLLK